MVYDYCLLYFGYQTGPFLFSAVLLRVSSWHFSSWRLRIEGMHYCGTW